MNYKTLKESIREVPIFPLKESFKNVPFLLMMAWTITTITLCFLEKPHNTIVLTTGYVLMLIVVGTYCVCFVRDNYKDKAKKS